VTLTAVERFSARHDDGRVPSTGPYRARLPLGAPGPGQQYAFEVDLDACTGCKACVTACHSMNGLDDGEAWRTVGLLVGTSAAYQQTVTTGCHHCVDPACMSGCPVDAYEKDPVTGIVHHLDDQCIGCRYCTLTCPYEVPRFNTRLGIVRKCDLCAPRLEVGEAPACVQGCPTSAISVTVVDVASVPATPWPIPTSPLPTRTTPTTVYRSTIPVPDDAVAADLHEVRPAAAHDPLATMLVLSQLAVGIQVAAPHLAPAVLAAALAALGSSLAHLGRPLHAWRAVIGLGHSWVSREIVAFSLFTALAALQAVALLAGFDPPAALAIVTAVAGISGVACSVAIYAATGRRWWSVPRLGAAYALATAGFACCVAAATGAVPPLLVVVPVAVELAVAALVLRHRGEGELARTASLLRGELRPLVARRVVLAIIGAVTVPAIATAADVPVLMLAALALLVAGEIVERRLQFTASAAPRMPGGRR
jgi:formate dehydrogenase iron-sulfur subunit